LMSWKVSVTTDGETRVYEAFPACEDDGLAGDSCFSLYLPELPRGAAIQVHCEGESVLLSEVSEVVYTE